MTLLFHFPDHSRPLDCEWSEWSEWSDCSVTCGRGGTQTRTRDIKIQGSKGGKICANEDSTQTILCSRIRQCPQPGKTSKLDLNMFKPAQTWLVGNHDGLLSFGFIHCPPYDYNNREMI